MSVPCPRCSSPLPQGGASCPACLLELGLERETVARRRPAVASPSASAPDRIGPYQLLRVLGEGGFGIVYLARQEAPLEREVALKVIKLGMDSREVIARFEAEQHALALMSHPGIAKVLDAGTTERGSPYFVMEHVPGVPITEYCDTHRLGIDERLALFAEVCSAVQHAHQKGIIHRDIKPSNVLVAIEDGKPVPKVIDFGISKAIDQRAAERRMLTTRGVIIGTPAYMAPEQADPLGLDIDTTTDVYSLGVLLYELLSGALPFDAARLRGAALDEMMRILRDEDPPSLPMRARQAVASSQEIATRRRTDGASLPRRLTGDLDWITRRALEKDRTRRYASASELAADVRRYLNDEPVTAGPPSRWYQLSKLVRRHRVAVVAGAAFVVVLAAFAATATWQAIAIGREATAARTARELASRRAYSSGLAAADAALQSGHFQEAQRRLAACEPSLRGWEWRHLSLATDASEGVLDVGGPVRGVQLLPGGASILAFTLKDVWTCDASTLEGRRMASVARADDSKELRSAILAISPDGTKLLLRREMIFDWSSRAFGVEPALLGLMRIVSPAGGDGVVLQRTTTEEIHAAAFSPDGTRLVTVERSGVGAPTSAEACRLWNAVTGEQIRVFPRPQSIATHVTYNWVAHQVAFSPDGLSLLVGSDLGSDVAWIGTSDGAIRRTVPCGDASIQAVAWSADSRRFAVACGSHALVFDVANGQRVSDVEARSPVQAVALSSHGTTLALAVDGVLETWSMDGPKKLDSMRGHLGGVSSVAFVDSDTRLVTGGLDGTVRAWSTRPDSGACIVVPLASGWSVDGAMSADGRRLASGGSEILVSRRLPDGVPPGLFAVDALDADRVPGVSPLSSALAVAVSPDGSLLAGAAAHALVIMRADDFAMDKLLFTGADATSGPEITSVAFSRDGSRVFASARDGVVRSWMVAREGPRIELHAGTAELTSVTVGPGDKVAAGDAAGTAWIWDDLQSAPRPTRMGDDAVLAVAMSKDGAQLAVGLADGRAVILDAATLGRPRWLEGHEGVVRCIAFSPDGSRVVTGAADTTLRTWDAETGEALATLRGHSSGVRFAAFTPDGSTLVSASSDGTFRIWRTR